VVALILISDRTKTDGCFAHNVMVEWYSPLGIFLIPFPSTGADISNTDKIEAIMIHRVDWAMCIPGQDLKER